jgi:catechol 2,3-dioxygenase-like lactoylglutathione lyase family enzyme
MTKVVSINHVSFTVSNLEKSVDFYTLVLGLKLLDISKRSPQYSAQVTGIPGAHLKIAYLSLGEAKLELIQYLAGGGGKINTSTHYVGSTHLCLNVSDINNFYKHFIDHGGKTVAFPKKIPAGVNKGRKGFYGEDPDSNKLEFISNEKYI